MVIGVRDCFNSNTGTCGIFTITSNGAIFTADSNGVLHILCKHSNEVAVCICGEGVLCISANLSAILSPVHEMVTGVCDCFNSYAFTCGIFISTGNCTIFTADSNGVSHRVIICSEGFLFTVTLRFHITK